MVRRGLVCEDPAGEFAAVIGDLNFKAPGEGNFKVGRSLNRVPALQHSCTSGTKERLWMSFLSSWIELVQPHPTHFDHKGNACSRLDRCWVACPSSLLIKLKIQAQILGSPEEMYGSEISDHCPLIISVGRKPKSEVALHALPKFICSDVRFKERLDLLVHYVDILNLPVHAQLDT